MNETDNDGGSALAWATERGHTGLVRLFLAHGAKVDQADNDGRTPLMRAAKLGQKAVVKILLQNGADTRLADKAGKRARDYAKDTEILSALQQPLQIK